MKSAIERVRAIAGVTSAAGSCCMPLAGGYGMPLIISGGPLPNGQISHGGTRWISVSPGYFETLQIPMQRGRSFTFRDDRTATPVVIINQALARQFWPKGDPLADRIVIGQGIGPDSADPPRQIIGIASDMHDEGLNKNPQPTVFVPLIQVPDRLNAANSKVSSLAFLVRMRGEPHALGRAIEKELETVGGGIPVAHMRTLDELIVRSTGRADFNMLLLTIFGVSALLLAAIGIYGLTAYSVEQRTSEIGIRMALGAATADVRSMVLWQGMRLVWIGAAIGLVAAFAFPRVIASLLFGVKSSDPLVFATVPIVLSAVALAAVWIPVRRATRISPAQALRHE